MPIDYKPFIHPEDRDALEKLKAVPLLDSAVKKYMQVFTEDMMHGINMASKIKLGPSQLPELYAILRETCETLQIPEPELFLEMDPIPNAYTYGDTKPFVVVNSGIIDLLSKEELKAVIAHECGHILCRHVLYHSLASLLVSAGSGVGSIFGLGLISEPLQWALMYWVRRSEFSADRVAAYVTNDADVVARTMMRLAGGGTRITERVDMEQFVRQAADYQKFMKDSDKSKLLQNWMIKDASHPYPAVRAAEVRKWFVGRRPSFAASESIGRAKLKW